MSLYQEIPKASILSVLRSTYSEAELDSLRLELDRFLHSCCTLDQLHSKLYAALQQKKQSQLVLHSEGNLMSF